MNANIDKIALENPVGAISSNIRQPEQIIQPYNFCADASKKTCLWLKNLPRLIPTHRVQGRWVYDAKRGFIERWGNQTDSGQNRLGPRDGRAEERSLTYEGIASCMARTWG